MPDCRDCAYYFKECPDDCNGTNQFTTKEYMSFITSNELGNDIVWHLERASEDGWSMWFDLQSQQTRVWDSSFPSLDENGLISDDWDKSFGSGKAAWDYVKSLT